MVNDNVIKKKFGDTLRYFRKKQEYSQEYVAEKAGLHRTYISDVERGDRNVSLFNIIKICHALNTRPSSFFKYMENEGEHNETES